MRAAPPCWLLASIAAGAILSLVAAACASDREMAEARAAVRAADAACSSCHAREAEQLDAARHHGGLRRALACLDCHLPHSSGAEDGVAPAGFKARCEDCHPDALAEFRLPFAHPLGPSIACTSCHSPHGLPPREERRRAREEACVGCHTEKRGPFVFPHEGDDTQGCLSCHEPHGSPNRRMLTHASSSDLCFSCHELLEKLHTQEPGSIFRQCLNCHTEIHGSNWSAEFYR